MHALLAHAYHLALYVIHLAMRPVWRPLGAGLGVAAAGRLAGFARRPSGAALVAGLAVLAGWVVEAAPLTWPLAPVTRLGGLALIVTIGDAARGRAGRVWVQPVTAALAAWWLRGAPLEAASILGCMPVFLAFWAGWLLAGRWARRDHGWGTLAAAAGLAGGLLVTGAAPHWARAAGVPGMAALGLLGVAGAMPALAGLIVAVSLAALVASDRGRLAPVDVACVVPLVAWVLVPQLGARWGGGALACIGAAALCVGLAWAAGRVMALG